MVLSEMGLDKKSRREVQLAQINTGRRGIRNANMGSISVSICDEEQLIRE